MSVAIYPDYTLNGVTSAVAIEKGLAEADWYTCPIPKDAMRHLLERRNGPAIRDTLIWFALLIGTGYWAYSWWGSLWAILPFALYGVLYGSTADSRWHESSHGTAFKTDWMNEALYEIASFMVMREATVWRWSHTRHHSDTIIVGRDPEIAVPRTPSMRNFVLSFVGWPAAVGYCKTVLKHCTGQLTPAELTFIPETEHHKVIRQARIYALVYLSAIALAIYSRSILPLLFIGLPQFYGGWLMPVYGFTQHAGLAENVLDHRLNCRTVYMSALHRYLYWNMNYHVEHHMFPLVPYHALPRLHELVKADMPKPYGSIWEAWSELLPAVLRQRKEPAYHVKRQLPAPAKRSDDAIFSAQTAPDAEGWIEVCDEARLRRDDVLRFDHGHNTYAVYRDAAGALYATDGICTHGNTHLADGLVIGAMIECPKHNGRYHLADGSPARAPICRGVRTYPVESRGGRLTLNVLRAGGAAARHQTALQLRVVSNRSVATFIKELVFEAVNPDDALDFTPGDYLQFDIPVFDAIPFGGFDIPRPYAEVWKTQRLFELTASNPTGRRRNNYSLACNPKTEPLLRFNVRIATPPPGQDCPPGAGSAYMFQLKPGDTVTAAGPYGDFHIKPTQREMIYIGGGSGMAPLRAHLAWLFETEKTARRVSFWYGARSRQELFYQEYFEKLAAQFPNLHFHPALSSPLPADEWTGHEGMIHEVVLERHLRNHPSPAAAEYYLCGPPRMIEACLQMLDSFGVPSSRIAHDEF